MYKTDCIRNSFNILPTGYICCFCGKLYSDLRAVHRHESAKHRAFKSEEELTLHSCSFPDCGKLYISKRYLKAHVLKHNKVIDLSHHCHSIFTNTYTHWLLFIIIIGIGIVRFYKYIFFQIKSFECGICHASFSHEKHVKNHVEVKHMGETKKHACDMCDKRYNFMQGLSRHKKRDHNTNPEMFKCETCERQFGFKIHLQRHIRNNSCPV